MHARAVIYESNTGYTEHYAREFASRVGLPVYTLKEAKKAVPSGADVVFFGWIMAGKIQGYVDAWKRYETPMVVSVGLSQSNEKFIEYMGQQNTLIDVQYFQLRGGVKTEELKGKPKLLMKIILLGLKKKMDKGMEVTEEEQELYAACRDSRDFTDLAALEPLTEWFRANQECTE